VKEILWRFYGGVKLPLGTRDQPRNLITHRPTVAVIGEFSNEKLGKVFKVVCFQRALLL
jgi:hypothetical protein